ncbi:hypothetical protein Pcinc_016909 [Petrolisthes cinctipes]|uniref:Uncharacterized protein n=1 Tax=Petrolisthes cinctipes TaxID=88211 RepID=A0AAE1FR98_PETCI|nr:hypothetical protein Pcinc_016909 [Petrolisthes cinctipes]
MRTLWVVVASCVFLATVHKGESVGMAGLEDYDAGLCYKGKMMKGVVGVCVLVRPDHTQRYNTTIILTHTLDSTVLYAGMSSFRLWVEVGDQRYNFNETLEKEVWNPLCVGHQPVENGTQVWAALRGNILTPSSIESSVKKMKGSVFCFGKLLFNDSSENAFTGFLASVSLLASIPAEPPSCQSLIVETEDSNFDLTFNLSLWNLRGPVFITQVQEDSLCSRSYYNVVLNRSLNYNDFYRLCRSLGGRPPNMEELKHGLMEVWNGTYDVWWAEREVADGTQEWLGKRKVVDGTYEWWKEGEAVSEAVTLNCPVLLLTNNTVGWRPCLSEVTSSLCRVPDNTMYTLYGAVKKFDRHYTLKLIAEGGFYLEGDATSSINKIGKSWVLHSRLHQEKWQLHNGSWPLGRHLWDASHDNVLLTLASCNILQFSSNDGVCLPRSRRCDGIKDFDDMSDEQNCHKRLFRKEISYDTLHNPYEERGENGSIWIQPHLFYIGKIQSWESISLIQGPFVFKWQDPRLTFVDLKVPLHTFPCQDLWVPRLCAMSGNLHSIGPAVAIKNINQICYIRGYKRSPEVRDLSDPFMGMLTQWENVNLTMEEHISISFPCQLMVHRYPFGRYQCNASLYLYSDWLEMEWKPDNKDLSTFQEFNYTGDRDLLDYFLDNVTMDMDNMFVTLTLHLSGRYEYHLLSSFCPSALMFIISYSTFFFPITDFNERIMGSLTSLLVLAGLFAQASDSYIKTPYFKLIDIWYAVLIMLNFGVVIINSLVNSLRAKRSVRGALVKDDYKTGERKNRRARVCNMMAKVVMLTAFIALLVVFFMFGAEIL